MSEKVAGLFPFKKTIAGLVTIVFLGTTIGQPWAEASFWGDRRKARDQFTRSRQDGEPTPLLLASANLGSAFGDARPIPVEPTAADVSRLSGPLLQSPLLRSLPYANISVRDAYLPSAHPRQLIIHIQDVHANLEAQKNIAASLVSLDASTSAQNQAPRLLVGLEGAEGPFFIDALRTFPDKEILNEGAEIFLKKDLLTGAEYAALTSRRGLDLWGVENRALYNRHVKAVVDATPLEPSLRKTLNDFGTRARALKDKEYTDALKAWDKEYENYHGERSSLGAYVQHIAQGASQGAFPQVERFLNALNTEAKLDFPQAERERKVLVEALAARLNPQDLATLTERAVAFRAGRLGFSSFHRELIALASKAGVTLKGSQEFLKYLEYVKLVEGIDRSGLLDEIDSQEKAYVARLLKSASPRASDVYAVSRDLVMADKLLRHALTPSEWTEYSKNADHLRNLPSRLSKLESGNTISTEPERGGFASTLSVFEEFYRAGVARNRVLVDNLFARMGTGSADGKNPAVAVLVAGGFHTDGVTALIKERGAAYVTLTPRFEVVNGQDSLDVFRQQKTPLDRLFAGEKLNLVEGLAGAQNALGVGRGARFKAEGPLLLVTASSAEAKTLEAWLAGLIKDIPSMTYRSGKMAGLSGYVVALEDGRELFAWQTESAALNAGDSYKFQNGYVNFTPYQPNIRSKVISFISKYKKQGIVGAVGAVGSALANAAGTTGVAGFSVLEPFTMAAVLAVGFLFFMVHRNRSDLFSSQKTFGRERINLSAISRIIVGRVTLTTLLVAGALMLPLFMFSSSTALLVALGTASLWLFRNQVPGVVGLFGNKQLRVPSPETYPLERGRAVSVVVPLLAAGLLWGAAIYFGIPVLADQLAGGQFALTAIAGSDISTVVGAAAFFGAKLIGLFGSLVSLTPTVAMLTGLAIFGRLALSFPAGQRALSFLVPKTPVESPLQRGKTEVGQGKIVSGVTHIVLDVMSTLYNFAFVQADRAFQLMVNGKLPEAVLVATPLTYTEKKYVDFREFLQKSGLSPLLVGTISALALPLIALQGIVVRRLYLVVLSTISNIGLTVGTGKVLMVLAPVFGFDPVLALGAIVGFSLLSHLDLIFGKGWAADYAQKSEVFRSLVLVASPFAAVNSLFLAFLMTSVKLLKQGGIKSVWSAHWWQVLGVQSFQSAFGKSFSLSGVLGSIHLVGFEIAFVKWIAHLTGGPVETVLLAIEGPQNSVLGAGNQVASSVGLGDVGSGVTAVTRDDRSYSVRDVQALSTHGLPRISWAMQKLEQNANDPVARQVLAGEPAAIMARLTSHIPGLPESVRGPLEALAKNPADVRARLTVQALLQGIIEGKVNVGDSKEVVGLVAHGLPLMADLQRQGGSAGNPRDQQRLLVALQEWGGKGGADLLLSGARPKTASPSLWGKLRTAWVNIGTAAAAESEPAGQAPPPPTEKSQGPVEMVATAAARSLDNILPGATAGKAPGTVEVTVQKGMTVGGIVRTLTLAGALLPGVASPGELKAAIQNTNNLNASYFIKEGQRLVIPLDPASLVRATSPPSARTEATPAPAAPEKAALPDLPGADSGPARGVPIDNFADVSRLVKQSLLSQRDAAKLEAARLREKAETLGWVPGVGAGAHAGAGESGVSVDVASRFYSESYARYVEAKRWADFTDADIDLMARDRMRQAGEALLSYRAVSETLKIKKESLRAMEAIPLQGSTAARANFAQSLKTARDEVRLFEKAEREAGRDAKNALGLRVKDDLRVKGGFYSGAEGQALDVYQARMKANSAKIHALSQELGTEGADEVARFFKETLKVEASASWFNEAGSQPLPQLGLSIDWRALNKDDVKKEFAERVQKAVELFNLKAANEQVRVEAAQARDQAVQQLKAIRENAKEAREALAAAEEFLKDQSANYSAYGGAESEANSLVRAIRLREEALSRMLAVQTAEAQARAQYRFAGGTGDPESVAPVSLPLGREDVSKIDFARLLDTAIKQRLGFSEKDIENAAHDGGWERLEGKLNANLRINGTFYKGGSPVALTFGVLLRDSNAETKAERAKWAVSRAEILVKAARNQVVNEVTSAYLSLRDAQEAQRLAIEAQGLQDQLVPSDPSHPAYFDRKAQSSAGRARLFDAKTNALNAWRSLQGAAGVDPAKAGATFRELTGSVAHDPTHAVETSKAYYDPKADKAIAAVVQVRIAELGLKMATNMDQYWDPKIGFAVTPAGGFVPLLWTDRIANIPATIFSPLTWPFRAMAGDTRFFVSPLDDRIQAETQLAEGQFAVAQENKNFEQDQKEVERVGAKEGLDRAEARVKRAGDRLGRAAGDLTQVEERARQKKSSSAEVVRQKAAMVSLEAGYQEALGDYRRALNRVHGLGLNAGTAALEAQSLPGLEKSATPATQKTVEAKSAQSVDPIKAALGYLKATTPTTASTAPGTLFGFTVPGASAVAGRVAEALRGSGDPKMAAALADAQKDYVAKSRAYEVVREFAVLAERNEKVARAFWLNVVSPQVENVFPGNFTDLRNAIDLANEAARLRDLVGKKTDEARLAVGRVLGRTPADADVTAMPSLAGRPPVVRWVGDGAGVPTEGHPAVRAAGAEGDAAVQLAKANALARHMPDLSFNIEEVQPKSGGDEKVGAVLRVYVNLTPSVADAVKAKAYKADQNAAALSQKDQIRQIENEMDDLAKRISDGSENLPALYESVQSARKNVGDKLANYERYGVAESGHATLLAGFGHVRQAIDNYNRALENYTKARADFEQSLARFNNLLVILGQNPDDFLQVAYDASGDPRGLALPPPASAKDDVKIPFPGLLPGSLSRPGFTFEQRFDSSRAPNDPLADLPTQYVELDLATGKPTGRVIDARYTVDAKDPARRTTAFIDHRPYGTADPRKTIPPTVSVFSEASLRSNPYNPYALPDATVGWDREDGWTVQSVTRGRAGRVVVDVVTPDGKRILDEVIRDGQGVRLKNQRTDVRLTKVSLVIDRLGQKAVQKATELGGRIIWEGQFTERQEPISFVDHRNKTRGRVTGRDALPRGSTLTLPGGGRAALTYGGSVVTIDGVDSQGKPMKTFDVLSDNFSSLGSVTNATVLRRDPAQPDAPGKLAISASYTRFGDRDAAELREGAAGYQRQGNNVAFTLPEKDPYARLAYRGESVYVLPTRDGGTPGLAFVSPRGGTLSTEVREGVKAAGLIISDPGTLRESMTYGAPLPNGLIPTETRNPKGSPIPGPTAFPTPSEDLMALTKRDQSAKTPEVKEREHPAAQPAKEKLPLWREWLNKVSDFFISKAGASDFEDIRATPKGLLDTDNKPVHLNGVNWRGIQYGWNFGDSVNGFARNKDWMEGELAAMKANGVNAVRIPLLDDGRHLKGDYSNFNQFKGDIQVFLDAAAKQGIHVEFVLFDFLAVARGKFDMSQKSTENFRTNFLAPFLKEFGRHPALLTIDLINEPEWILDKNVPGGWGDKMEGGRRAVNSQEYQRFVASMSGAIKDSKLKDKDGKSVAGHVLVTVGTSVKHHATATDPAVRTHLDYYSWHHYDWMGPLSDYLGSVPLDNKSFEIGEYATDGTKTAPADYMRIARTNQAGVGAFAWNWGARVGQKIDEHTTANADKLRADLKAAGEVSKDLKAKPVVSEGKPAGSAVKEQGVKETSKTGTTPIVAPGSYQSYRAPDGTTYTPMPDGKTVIRSIGDPFDPANESDQRVIAVPAGFDFRDPAALSYLDDPAHAARTLTRGVRYANGLTAVEVHSSAKPREDNLVRVFYQDKSKNTYTQQSDGTWTITPWGAKAPSVVVNPREGFRADAPDALARLTAPGNRVGFYTYELASQIERKGKYDIPAPAGTYAQRYYGLDQTGSALDSERPMEVRAYIFSEAARGFAADPSNLLTQALRPNLNPAAAARIDWDVTTSLSEPILYQRERLGLTYDAGSVELILAQKIAASAKTSYGTLLVDRVQTAQEGAFRERHGLGPNQVIPPTLLPLQREEAERRVDEYLMMSAVDLVPSMLARSIGMADKVNANDVREAVSLIRDGKATVSLDNLVARFTLTGSLASNRAVLDAMESLIKSLSGSLNYQEASQVMQILYHLNTIPFVGTDEVGRPAVRPAVLDGKTMVQIIKLAEKNAVQLRESFLKRYPQRERATALFSAEGLGVLLYWATVDMVTPVPLVRKAEREKTHPVGPPETMIVRAEAIERAKRPSFAYFLEALDTPVFKKFLERWHGPHPSYANFLESATLLTNQMVKNQSVLTPEIMREVLSRLSNGDHTTIPQEVDELLGTKDEVRVSRGKEALVDAIYILLWILVPLGLGRLFKLRFRKKGEAFWTGKQKSSPAEIPLSEAKTIVGEAVSAVEPESVVHSPAYQAPSGVDMAPLLTDLSKNLATVGGDLAGDFRKGHQALEQGRFFMKSTAGPRVTIASWRLTNFLSMGAGIIIFLAQAYAVATFGSWGGFTSLLWGVGALFFLNGLLGNFLSWKMIGLGGLILLAMYGISSGAFTGWDWTGILAGGTLSSTLKWRSPTPETDWIGARILASWIQSHFPRLVLWGWTDWKDEKVDPKQPKPSHAEVAFNWLQKQLGIRFTRLPSRADRQEKMVGTLLGSIDKAQERMDLLWVDLSPELRDDWKREVLFRFGSEAKGIPSFPILDEWIAQVLSAYRQAFPGRPVPEGSNAWVGAYAMLGAEGKKQQLGQLISWLEIKYGSVLNAYRINEKNEPIGNSKEFLEFSTYLKDIPTSWLAAYSKLGDVPRASLREWLDKQVSARKIDRDSLQAQVRELSRVWAAPPLGLPDDYVYVESIKVDFFEWIDHSKDWLKFLQGKADTYQIFSRTHYPNYDPQYHDPIFYVRGPDFEVLRRNNGNIYLMPGTHEDHAQGYSQVTDADRFAYNGPARYTAHPLRWFSAGIGLLVVGYMAQWPILTAVGVLFLVLSTINRWRGGWPAIVHPAPLYNIAYYAQMVADRTRTTRDYMAGTVYPINEYRRALLPYRGIVENQFPNGGLAELSDEDFFPRVWMLTNGNNVGSLRVYPTLQAFLDDNLGQSVREEIRRAQARETDPARMSFEDAAREEETDRNNMVNPAIAAHKGLQGPGPTNSSQGNTLRQNQITLVLIAIAFFVLVPVALSLRMDILAAVAEGIQPVSTGLFAGVPVLGEVLRVFTNTIAQFVSLENVEFLVFNGTGISLFSGITFGMGAFALLMVGMVFKIILFFQGFKSQNRLADLGFGVSLLGAAGALWFLAPLSWFAVMGALLFAFVGIGWLWKTALATRYKEELTNDHIYRFVPEHFLEEALSGVTDAELTTIGVTREQFNGWLNEYGASGAWRRLAEREDSILVLVKSALMGIPNTQRPIHRLRQDDRYNLLKIVYLANIQGPRRRELIIHLLKLYQDSARREQLNQRLGGTQSAQSWLDRMAQEVDFVDAAIQRLGDHPLPEDALNVYFEANQRRSGQFNNDDIVGRLSFADIIELKENKVDHESLWPKIILMQTAFGATSEERLFALLESADALWPSIQVDITLDDNDEAGRSGVLKSMKDPKRLGKFADRIVVSNHAAHGTNLGVGNIHQRHKPMMNAEAVFRLNYRFKKFLGRLPFFQTLVDMEDVFLKEVLDDKMAIWAMRERTINEQLARRESEETRPNFDVRRRWRDWSRTGALVLLVGGVAVAVMGFGSALAAPALVLAGISSGSWLGMGGLATSLAGWVYRRRTAARESVDSKQWGIRLDSDALEYEYKNALQGLATAAGLGRKWAKNNFFRSRDTINDSVSQQHLTSTFNDLQSAFLRERDFRAKGDVPGAEAVRVAAVHLAESLTAEERALYQLWAYAQVFPTFKDFRRHVFRIRNMPDVIQTELRQVPVNAADRRFSELSHIDYLFWHNTIQIGEDASGFMFLGGTGNTFMWELLGGTDDHAYVRLSRMLWPVREANRKEETERPLLLRVLLLIPLPLGFLSVFVPSRFRSAFEQARATWVSSRTLYKYLNRYIPTGVWDKFNIIEDSERGRRSAFLGLTSHRLVGRDKEVLEDALPRLGPKWLNQRQRWIIQQTFFAIIRFLPVGLMFFGQYLGAGLGFALIGDRAHVIQGLLGMGTGFVLGGVAAYLVGLVIFRWLGRAGIIRNTQFYVNPLVGLSPDRGPGLWRGMVSRVKAYYKFQQISHLAASVPMMMASSVLVTITLLYFLGFFFNIGPVMEIVEGLGSPGLTGFVGMMVVFIQTFFPLIEAVVPTTFWGILIFLYPPVAMNLMALVTVLYTSWRDDESIRAAIQTKFTSRVHSFLFLFVSTGMNDDDPFDLAGAKDVKREEDKIIERLREVEKNSAGQFVPKFRGLNRQILEGFLLTTSKGPNLARLNGIIAELQSIAKDLTHTPDNALDRVKLLEYTERTRVLIEGRVKPLLVDMGLSEENRNQIMDKLLEDQTELEDTALGRLRYGWRTFSVGAVSVLSALALVWYGWDYPLWLGAFLLALGSALIVISLSNLVWNVPAYKGSVQMRNFVVQAGRSLKMYFYFTFLHPSAWRNFGVAVNSFYKPGANEPFWTRGRDEGLGDLSLWELTPKRRFQIWWAGTGKTILQYTVFPFIILASLPWLTAVHDWRTKVERELGVEQVKLQIVTKASEPTAPNWASWDRAVASALLLKPEAFQGWTIAQIEEAGRLYRESKDRDPVMERIAMRMLDASLFAVRTYADGLVERTNWNNPIEAQKAIWNYEEVIQSVQKALAGMGQMNRFEKIFPGLALKPVPILNQTVGGSGKLNPRDVLIEGKTSTADRPTPRSVVVELRIPQSDLTGQVVAVASRLWPTGENTKIEVRVDQVSFPKDGNLASPEVQRKDQGASAQRLPIGRDPVQTFVFHSYSPSVLAQNYTAEKVNELEIVAYTRGAEPFEARMRFEQILIRPLADPRVNVPVLSVPRASATPNTIAWLWKPWNRFMGQEVSTETMVTDQAPWESYWMAALAGGTVPVLIFFQWSPVFLAGFGILWGLLHLGGTFDTNLKPISGFKALVPSLIRAAVAAMAVGLFAVGLDFLLSMSPLSEYLARMALFEGGSSFPQISLFSNLLVALPISLLLAGPLFKLVHQTLNKKTIVAAVPISKMPEAIGALPVSDVERAGLTAFLVEVVGAKPLGSLNISREFDPLVIQHRLAQEVSAALGAMDANRGGRFGTVTDPSFQLGRMMAPGVERQAFNEAVRNYAFALGYQTALSGASVSTVSLLEVAYLTVASRSAEVGVHMNAAGFAEAFRLGAAFAQEAGVRDNEAAEFHIGEAELAGKESNVLEEFVAAVMAESRAVEAGRVPAPIELVSSDLSVTSEAVVLGAVRAYVEKKYPLALAQLNKVQIHVRLAGALPVNAQGLIDSEKLLEAIKVVNPAVTGLACFTSHPEQWTPSDLARIIPLEKVLAGVLLKLEAMKATDDNA